jgi:hypothetical protein
VDTEAFEALRQRTALLERRLRAYTLLGILCLVTSVGYACAALPASAALPGADAGVLRVRGIVVVDDAGRERILIGAPIPAAANRVRTDPARVRGEWAPGMSRQYMEWYESYRHHMHGMLILDEKGFDRVMIGDSVPDPNIGRRIAPSTGLIINDERGFERSGYGLMQVGEHARVVLGLDSNDGREGVVLALSDDGFSGLMVHDPARSIILGSAPAEHGATGMNDPLHGLVVRLGREVRYQFNAEAPPR